MYVYIYIHISNIIQCSYLVMINMHIYIYMYDYYVNLYIYMHTVGGSTSSEINFATAIGQKNTPMIADIALNAQIKLAKIPMISPIPG